MKISLSPKATKLKKKKKQTKEFHPLSDEAANEISCICNNVSAVYMQPGKWGCNL